MRSHQKLDVWQAAMSLVKQVYQVTASFPKAEIYGLISQMRRAAVSIPSNISEGAARLGDREFLKFLFIARGSLSELETQILIAKDLGFLSENNALLFQTDKVFALLGGLINSIQERVRG